MAPVLEHYGLDEVPDGRNRTVRCPFHDDRIKSASYDSEQELFQCFTCGVRGDVYAVIMQVEGIEFVEAKRRAEEIARRSGHEVRGESRSGNYLPFRTRYQQKDRRGRTFRGRNRSRSWS